MGSRSGGPGAGAGAGQRMEEPHGGTEKRWWERKKQIVAPVPLCKWEARRAVCVSGVGGGRSS